MLKSGSSKESTLGGRGYYLPLEGDAEMKAPVFALDYAEAEGRRKNRKSMPKGSGLNLPSEEGLSLVTLIHSGKANYL